MKTVDPAYIVAVQGLEKELKRLDQECLWDIFETQGFQGLIFVLRSVPKDISKAIWTYIKNNKSQLRFYHNIPDDI